MRRLLALLAGVALGGLATAAGAQTFPAKPIRVIVPFGAGSAVDVIPRIILDEVSRNIGQAIVVEPRPGAGGTTGSVMVAKADPDGYTLLVNSSAHTIVPWVYSSLSFDPIKDFAAVAGIGVLPNVLVTSPANGFKTVADLVAAAKAKPGTFNMGSAGVGTATHLSAEKFRLAAGFDAAHVPFKGGSEAMTETIAGRIQYYFSPSGTAVPLIREGRLSGLVVSTAKRIAALPDVPTTLEAGYAGSDYTFWVGLFAPAKTPRAVIDKLHQEITRAQEAATVKERLAQNGVEPFPITPAAFDAHVAAETRANEAIVKAIGLKSN